MSMKKVTVKLDRDDWRELKSLEDPSGNANGTYHLREALKLYLKLMKVEGTKRSLKIRGQKRDYMQ